MAHLNANRKTLSIAFFVCASLANGLVHAQNFRGIKNWKYIPVQENFWRSIEEGLSKPNAELFHKAQLQTQSKTGLEKAEGELAQILILRTWGLNVLAHARALKLIEANPGSMMAERALVLIEDDLRTGTFDDTEIRRLLGSGQFNEIPDDLIPFAWTMSTLQLRQKNLSAWAKNSEANIPEKSYWAQYYNFSLLASTVRNEPADKMLEKFDELLVKAKDFPSLQNQINIQRARLFYEMQKYEDADKLYSSLRGQGREDGRLYFERAWTKYFLKDYSVTLGMLVALKTQLYRPALDPEQAILAMVSYRDLCHYPAVRLSSKDYFSVYKPAIDHIQKVLKLEDNSILMDMALQKTYNQNAAAEIANLKIQKNQLPVGAQQLSRGEQAHLVQEMNQLDFVLRGRMARVLQNDLKEQAERLLQVTEQVKLLEYVSDLDEFRLKQAFENRTYKTEKVENFAIDRLYWPVQKEYWLDEMKNYRVLIEDRCKPKEREVR